VPDSTGGPIDVGSNSETGKSELYGMSTPLGVLGWLMTAAKNGSLIAFVNEDPLYLQSTGFVLNPGRQVVVSVYSSGAIGRLVPGDVTALIGYLREHAT
jgi:hypothetical protein